LRALIRHGAAISGLDQFSVEADFASGNLVRLLPQWLLPTGGVYAVHPPGRRTPRKVRSFIKFCRTVCGVRRA